MEEILLAQLNKLTDFQKQAAIRAAKVIGFDMFIKSALFRAMKKGDKQLVFDELQKWCYSNRTEDASGLQMKLNESEMEKIKKLWERLG